MRPGSAASPSAPPAGTGTIGAIVDAAAAYWENLIHDNVTLDIHYRWLQLGTNLGQAEIFSSGPAIVSFDIDTTWFLDATPTDNSEYGPMQTDMIGPLSTGKYFQNGTGHALNFDLLSVAIHEIGHVVAGATSFDVPITVTAPRPSAGLVIQTTSTSHLDTIYPNALMAASLGPRERRLISDYDLLAVAQTGNYTDVSAVPEPSPAFYLAFAGAVAGCVSIRKRILKSRCQD